MNPSWRETHDHAALLSQVHDLAQLDLRGERPVAQTAAGCQRVADQHQQPGYRRQQPREHLHRQGRRQRDGVGVLTAQCAGADTDDDDDTVYQKTDAYFRQELQHQKDDPTYTPVDWIWFGNTRTTLTRLGHALARTKAALGIAPKVISDTFGVDEFLYREVPKPIDQRSIPTTRLALPEAAAVFAEWERKPDKVRY